MLTSVKWLNRYLEPADLTPDEAVRVLEATSFPIESRDDRPDGDAVLDVEVTSNRGDCLCHLGLAREVGSVTGRALVAPKPHVAVSSGRGGAIASITGVENRVPEVCPRFTARVIRNVTIGPSPEWLVDSLARVGQRSINNVVDVSNFVLHELGHPTHAFDLDALREKRLIVRYATEGEALTVLDGKRHALRGTDLVVADAERAVSLAGVIGGLETGVTPKTTTILFEAATWDPLVIRATARRLGISTDAGYRFERFVDPRDLEWASARAAALIVEVAGGEVVEGMIDEGRAPEARTVVELRPARCEHLLGKAIAVDEMERLLTSVGFDVEIEVGGAVLRCAVPHFRPDVTREVDVIEEVARLHGMDSFAVAPRLEVPLEIDHPGEWEARERIDAIAGEVLTGAGFYETVTFSFATARDASMFLERGHRAVRVDEDRRRETPCLRPSIVPSLMTCRRANQDAGVDLAGGVRLYEIASTFAEEDDAEAHGRRTVERRMLALLMDAGTKRDERQAALRTMRGAIESLVSRVGGRSRTVTLRAASPEAPLRMDAHAGAVVADVVIDAERAGWIGILGAKVVGAWDLAQPVVVGEIEMSSLMSIYPATDRVEMPPAFPAIERDLSLVLDESVGWDRVAGAVRGLDLAMLEGVAFVGVFRGAQVGAGKKSLTVRLRFRAPDRTLRHEEVDPQVEQAVGAMGREFGATLRA